MSILGVNGALAGVYQYAGKAQEIDRRYYRSKEVSAAAYERSILQMSDI